MGRELEAYENFRQLRGDVRRDRISVSLQFNGLNSKGKSKKY